ncbi:unnamed protein product [Candidula unifasciata]|uniref:Uncharacterized protein n=1 Tax=Candidula unifasciata TaxID=100452 RepID=A0A8S4A697_9EUPU|nr:unnamed protein product [Candidula unifasciata]
MDEQNCVFASTHSVPIFSFARLRRCVTLDSEDKSKSGDQKTSSSASMSSIHNNNISNAVFNNHRTIPHHSVSFSETRNTQSVTSPVSPPDSHRNGLLDFAHFRCSRKPPIDPKHRSTSKTRPSSTSSSASSHSSSPKSTPTTTPTATSALPKFFSAIPIKPRPLTKTAQSTLTFNSSQVEKPVFRRYLSLIVFPSSLKQIPFTVPASPYGPKHRSGFRKGEYRSLDYTPTYGRSEPTSPTAKRPSVEIPGAYALGSIDPALYKVADEDDHYDIPPDHIGRVWFATEYERETERLMVTLIKAKNLPSRTQGVDNSCDPFVR